MHENSTQKLNDIAYLFSQIQKHVDTLSGNVAGIIQEFFDSQFGISVISEIYELPKDEVKKIISDFLVELLGRKHGLQRFLSISCVEGKDTVVGPREEANLLIETCETPESTAAKIREVIGTAIRISIPPMPPNLCAETISKVNAVIKLPKSVLKHSHKTKLEHVPFIIELGEKLRLVRNRLALSKKDLAEKAGINTYYVNKLEEGKGKPRSEIVVKLAKALNVSVDFFSRGILADTDMLNLANIPLNKIRPENFTYRASRDATNWELRAPSLGDMKETLLEDIVNTEDWTITLTAENMVCLARIISKLITSVAKVESIVALSPRASIIAGALSAVFYEKKKSQKISIVTPAVVRGELVFADKSIRPGLNIMLLEEVVRTADDFLKTADEIKNRKGKVVAAVGVLDLLQPKEQKRILDVLPMYKYVFSSHDIASVLEQNRK